MSSAQVGLLTFAIGGALIVAMVIVTVALLEWMADR